MSKKSAFTFLEVMFGLAIVCLISSMVIPIFYNSYANRVMGTELKKVTGLITTAAKEIISDERANDEIDLSVFGEESDTSGNTEENTSENTSEGASTSVSTGFYLTTAGAKTSNSTQGVEYFMKKYISHTKVNCGSGGTNDCVGAKYRSHKKTDLGTIPSDFYCIRTVNSATICMKHNDDTNLVNIIIDVNGSDRPNIPGVDTFTMYITSEGDLKDIDEDENNCDKERESGHTVWGYAAGCFTKIIANGWKMPNN